MQHSSVTAHVPDTPCARHMSQYYPTLCATEISHARGVNGSKHRRLITVIISYYVDTMKNSNMMYSYQSTVKKK